MFVTALYATACSSPEVRRHVQIMDDIERTMVLPPGAGNLGRFARAYKLQSSSEVIAFYFVPEADNSQLSCEVAKVGGPANGQLALLCPPPVGMRAGERRWFSNDVHLPDVCDGGCNYIDVRYDIRTRKLLSAVCHGVA